MTSAKAHEYATKAASYAPTVGIRNYRLGAVAIVGQRAYGGWNSYHTHPAQLKYGKNQFAIHLHAEVSAMVRSKWRASVLVVVRVMADGSWGDSRPCVGCQRALASVPEVWYSNSKGELVLL